MRALPPLVLTVALSAGPLCADTLHVPGTHATVQEAIDSASPGDVVVVHGGTHPPIVVDVPITIVGDPAPTFWTTTTDPGLCGGCFASPIRLDGPGSGTVTLANLRAGGLVSGFFLWTGDGGVDGGGFEELRVYDCTLEPPAWTGLTGQAAGFPGIDVTIPSVLVSSSTIRGSNAGNDGYCYGGGAFGGTGIRAIGSTVVVLDSTVTGGGSDSHCAFGAGCEPSYPTGFAGTGVRASKLFVAASAISGGTGAEFYDQTQWPFVYCGQGPDGNPTDVEELHDLGDALTVASGDLALGSSWTLEYASATQPAAVLAVSTDLEVPPVPLLGGLAFLELGSIVHLQTVSVPGSFGLTLGSSPALIGVELAVQVFEVGAGLSRPVVDIVRP